MKLKETGKNRIAKYVLLSCPFITQKSGKSHSLLGNIKEN